DYYCCSSTTSRTYIF
nr:immunoglobulin light chain junction region [Macaca mulatta]